MTYNEWRDELKRNLLCVSVQERDRVLDYYAEAYADRRDAGFSEREITAEFGAPYDAAQRILAESCEKIVSRAKPVVSSRKEEPEYDYPAPCDNRQYNQGNNDGGAYSKSYPASSQPQAAAQNANDRSWVFVLLCVVFAIPLFGVIMSMVGVTVGFFSVPIAFIVLGVAAIGDGIAELLNDFASGAAMFGFGLMALGLSLITMPLFFKLTQLIWKLFIILMNKLKNLFSVRGKN